MESSEIALEILEAVQILEGDFGGSDGGLAPALRLCELQPEGGGGAR
jgi:hypothetical protein